jgi:hypothetical protein
MQIAQLTSPRSWLRRLNSLLTTLRAVRSRGLSSVRLSSRRIDGSLTKTAPALRIARYNLVLMDHDGQVVWTREWDSGGVFEFRPRQHLWVFCGFTNHSELETEISEYEIELMGEDGSIVERFGNSFGDPVIVSPGERKHFQAEWRM